jgi:hypothetical protein
MARMQVIPKFQNDKFLKSDHHLYDQKTVTHPPRKRRESSRFQTKLLHTEK